MHPYASQGQQQNRLHARPFHLMAASATQDKAGGGDASATQCSTIRTMQHNAAQGERELQSWLIAYDDIGGNGAAWLGDRSARRTSPLRLSHTRPQADSSASSTSPVASTSPLRQQHRKALAAGSCNHQEWMQAIKVRLVFKHEGKEEDEGASS